MHLWRSRNAPGQQQQQRKDSAPGQGGMLPPQQVQGSQQQQQQRAGPGAPPNRMKRNSSSPGNEVRTQLFFTCVTFVDIIMFRTIHYHVLSLLLPIANGLNDHLKSHLPSHRARTPNTSLVNNRLLEHHLELRNPSHHSKAQCNHKLLNNPVSPRLEVQQRRSQ